MKVIYKYPIQLRADNTLKLPNDSIPLHFNCIDGELFVWVEQSPNTNDRIHHSHYEFFVIGTGQAVIHNSVYIGTALQTIQVQESVGVRPFPKTFVWHLYYQK